MIDRHRHQQQVDALLSQIEQRRHQAYVRRAGGVQPAGLRDLKTELQSVRSELAAAVDAAAGVSL